MTSGCACSLHSDLRLSKSYALPKPRAVGSARTQNPSYLRIVADQPANHPSTDPATPHVFRDGDRADITAGNTVRQCPRESDDAIAVQSDDRSARLTHHLLKSLVIRDPFLPACCGEEFPNGIKVSGLNRAIFDHNFRSFM